MPSLIRYRSGRWEWWRGHPTQSSSLQALLWQVRIFFRTSGHVSNVSLGGMQILPVHVGP